MFSKVWSHISFAGIEQSQSGISTRTLVLSNQMSAVLMVLTVALLLAMWVLFPQNTVILSWLTVLAAGLVVGVWLNGQGKTGFSQFLLSSGLPLILLVSTIHSKLHHPWLIHEGSYYNPRYFLIGLSFVPLVVFDIRQRTSLIISLGLNLGILFLYNPIHALAGASPETIGITGVDFTFVTIASSSAAAAIVVGMIFLKRSNHRYEQRIQDLLKKTSHQNEELNAGIRYARKLQESILTHSAVHQAHQPIVFLRPKDVLSGDFYFCEEQGDQIILGVVDCTGHGVPGAFVSIMAYRALAEAVASRKDLNPGTLLDLMDHRFRSEFGRGQTDMLDGADVSLCVIDKKQGTMRYAGAKGLMFLHQANQLHTLETDRRSIGETGIRSFVTRTCAVQPGDLLVLTSDGFADQFGGEENKKFGKPRLRKLITELSAYPNDILPARLGYVLSAWQGQQEQTDDICMLMYRI